MEEKTLTPQMPKEFLAAFVADLERHLRVAQDLVKRAKALPKNRDLAAAMITNLAMEARMSGCSVHTIAREIHEVEERMEKAEFGEVEEDEDY